jgi:xanthine dehydrogenase accessory factor
LIASRRKAPVMTARLKEELGKEIDLSALYSPVGLDIGGASPDEIAISIISELQAVRNNKTGHKHMRL